MADLEQRRIYQMFATYVVAKQQQHVLDYDDLLLYWAQMMQEPSIAVDVSRRYDHVLVDEYQDTNRLQASVLLALKPNGRGLTVVGDDAPVDLFVPRCDGAKYSRLPRSVQSPCGNRHP